ncbi:MAG: hypothetical protein QOI66_4478 [Myxococcales bacterium]|nr:hypothetical protein [Myxococcales bacterium]
MAGLPCTKCGEILTRPAYFRTVTVPIAPRDSLMRTVFWLCEPCFGSTSPEEQATWVASKKQAPEQEPKARWREALFPWLRRRAPHNQSDSKR